MTLESSRDVLEATVKKLSLRGLWVEVSGSNALGWLPASEWSYEPSEWSRERARIRAGQKLRVIKWGKSLADGHVALSKRRVDSDPWDSVTPKWIGKVKFFSVSRLTKNFAIGELRPGLQARIDHNAFARYLSSRDTEGLWESHKTIALGDLVGGIVAEIRRPEDYAEPEIVLEAYELLESLEQDPSLLVTDDLTIVSPQDTNAFELIIEPSTLDIDHVLVVDNDAEFASGVAHALTSWGFKVSSAFSEEEATTFVASCEPESIQMALIDVHLLQDDNLHDGLHVAHAIKDRHARCRLILISGEGTAISSEHNPAIRRKILEAEGLSFASYLAKPFTIEELQQEMTEALHRREQSLESLLAPVVAEPMTNTLAASAVSSAAERPTYRHSLSQAVAGLGSALKDVVVHIFEMDPIDFRARSIAHYGEGLNWERVRHKLSKSPVKDTAVNRERQSWVTHDVLSNTRSRGRHFWLREAMAYRSALGIPIRATSPLAYCLIALHSKPGMFSSEFVLQAELCAERAARALEWDWVMKQSTERALFEKAGMGFSFLAHELRTMLTTIDADAYTVIEMLTSGLDDKHDLLAVAASLKKNSGRAVKAARTLTGVKGSNPHERLDIIECIESAARAAVLQIPDPAKIQVRTPAKSESVYISRGDRSSLILAIFNLLLNSVQQISLFPRPEGLIWIEWHRVDDHRGSWVIIDFHDTGPGIHAANQQRIFEMGFTTRPDGSGMGLHICREIVESIRGGKRKGRIEVYQSILNVGTTFRLTLPL